MSLFIDRKALLVFWFPRHCDKRSLPISPANSDRPAVATAAMATLSKSARSTMAVRIGNLNSPFLLSGNSRPNLSQAPRREPYNRDWNSSVKHIGVVQSRCRAQSRRVTVW